MTIRFCNYVDRKNGANDLYRVFSQQDTVGDIYEWLDSVPRPFQGKEGLHYNLICQRKGRGWEGMTWVECRIEELELDGCRVLVEFGKRVEEEEVEEEEEEEK